MYVRSCTPIGVGGGVVNVLAAGSASSLRQLRQAKGALGVAQPLSATAGRNRNPASGGTPLSKPEGPVFPKGAVNTRCCRSSELLGGPARQERESSEAQAETQTRM